MTTVTTPALATVEFFTNSIRRFTGTVDAFVALAVAVATDATLNLGDDSERLDRIRAILTAADAVRAEQRAKR
jgi:FlaG/FlaF family flagellin (archaellin)